MKSGKCTKCHSFNVYFKAYALTNVTLDVKYFEEESEINDAQ